MEEQRVFRQALYGDPCHPDVEMLRAWACYYLLTDAYDLRVCTAQGKDGPLPANSYEHGLVARYAASVLHAIREVRQQAGLSLIDASVRDGVLRMDADARMQLATSGGLMEKIEEQLDVNRDRGRHRPARRLWTER